MRVTRFGLRTAARAVAAAAVAAAAVAAIGSIAAAQSTHTLTIFTSAGGYLGTAQVTSSPAGIDCRSESSGLVPNGGTCATQFPAGSTVTLTASPLYGGTLDGWTGACAGQGATCQLVMTGALTTSPKTIAKTFTLTILGTGNSSGSLSSVDLFSRPRVNCGIGPGGVTSGTCQTEVPRISWRGSLAMTEPSTDTSRGLPGVTLLRESALSAWTGRGP